MKKRYISYLISGSAAVVSSLQSYASSRHLAAGCSKCRWSIRRVSRPSTSYISTLQSSPAFATTSSSVFVSASPTGSRQDDEAPRGLAAGTLAGLVSLGSLDGGRAAVRENLLISLAATLGFCNWSAVITCAFEHTAALICIHRPVYRTSCKILTYRMFFPIQ